MDFLNIELNGLDEKGKETKVKLKDLSGKNIVLYFYPKDNTPICTIEANDFKNAIEKFPKNTVIIGVSPDNIDSHRKFFEKHKLNFHILSDIEHKLANAFGVIKGKMGEHNPAIIRSTFIIDKNGKILKEMRNIDIKGHVDEIVEFVKKIKE